MVWGTARAVKRVLLGPPRESRQLKHQLLPKWLALPVFSSDPLSSVAYATQEMMLVLSLAGVGAYALVRPLSLGVAALLVVVVLSYRQTVRAYPHGGGAYIVARDNLGDTAGLVAGSALLIDYVLTVAVSVAAGVAVVVSAWPALDAVRVVVALVLVAVVTVTNLRGLREAGMAFAIPTYLFVVVILSLIVIGGLRCLGGCPQVPATARPQVTPEGALTLFVVLRAFASGATALTGVEAISNGVPAFRYPQSRNAANTLAVMGALAVVMFLGISLLAGAVGAVAAEGMQRTVVAQIALAVFGEGPGFYLVLIATAAILFLAANTAYADFPRLASVLARDRYLPRQFRSRGDRLVFSNGIIVLGVAAALLLVAFDVRVTRLIQLYVVGVFTSFTLSQAGMVRRWLSRREQGWQRSVALNGVGATATGIVLVVVAVTKFTGGAWIVLLGIASVVAVMRRIQRHYDDVATQLRAGLADAPTAWPNHMVVLLDRVDEAAARALSYARAAVPASLQAIAVPLPGTNVEERWHDLAGDVPLTVLQDAHAPGTVTELTRAVRELCDRHGEQAFTTAVIPETLSHSWLDQLRHHRLALRLKAELLGEPGLVVCDLTSPEGGPGPYTVEDPAEHHVLVLVAGVNIATLRALAYAQGLQATSVQALHISLSPEAGLSVLRRWEDWGVATPLEVVDSPFRSLTDSLRASVREFAPDGRHTIVTCVLPEFIVARWWEQGLHNQTALLIKNTLLFERGVVTASVPVHLHQPSEAQRRQLRA